MERMNGTDEHAPLFIFRNRLVEAMEQLEADGHNELALKLAAAAVAFLQAQVEREQRAVKAIDGFVASVDAAFARVKS